MKTTTKVKMNTKMKTKSLIAASLLSALSMNASAQELSISITNLTQGIHFTPYIIAAHPAEVEMYTLAEPASHALQLMAEGAVITELNTIMTDAGGNVVMNPAEGLLKPATTTNTTLTTTDGNLYLSITSMLLETNDAFVGLDSWVIPTTPGTYTLWLDAYDAGTEANDELLAENGRILGVPGMPSLLVPAPGSTGLNGTGISDPQSNTKIHVHRGSLGDDDLTGGKSDLDNRVHRWLNPVNKVTVTVQ